MTAACENIDDLLAAVPPTVAELIRAADDLFRRTDPDVVAVYWPRQRTAGYGVGPQKMSEHYAYLAAFDRHVNVGFNYGAALADEGLLGGTGKSMRSLKVDRVELLDDPRLVRLIRTARQERLAVLGRA
jgi:hypothetical protein